jgi:tetratricopeptide (TPR) repeat protein
MKPSIFFYLFLLAVQSAAAQTIQGKYRFLADNDGRSASARAIIILDLFDKTFRLRAEQPGKIVTDEGTYQINGQQISFQFKEMEQGKKSGKYSFQNGILTLPFRMLDAGNGHSTWQLASLLPENKNSVNDVTKMAVEGARKNAADLCELIDYLSGEEATTVKGGMAEGYYITAVLFYFKNLKWGSLYGFAKATELAPNNALYQNNLSQLLLELGRLSDARVVAENVTKYFPSLDPGWNQLAYTYYKLGALQKADSAIRIAMRLNPESGLYCYTAAKIAEERGRKQEAQTLIQKAWDKGYAGNGREGAATATASNKSAQPVKSAKNQKPNTSPPPKSGYQKKDWSGTYYAKYIAARSGETAQEETTVFGSGMASTALSVKTLACVKDFTMHISASGQITGSGEIMYVYQGTTGGPITGLFPAVMTGNNFSVNLKDGYQLRKWHFSGTVSDNGEVVIQGLPQEKMDLLNVGKWEKISPWSPLPPKATGAAMKGPFNLKLQMDENKNPFIYIDQYLDLNDKLIKRVHYTGWVVRTDERIVPDCKPLPPPEPARCPASEYIKTKVTFSPRSNIVIENSKTYTKGADGKVQTQSEMATNVTTPEVKVPKKILDKYPKLGLLQTVSSSVEFHTDGSYEFSIGVGVSTEMLSHPLAKASPVELKERLDLIYDSRCGFGVKASAGVDYKPKAGPGNQDLGSGIGASVEGAIFFKKGL